MTTLSRRNFIKTVGVSIPLVYLGNGVAFSQSRNETLRYATGGIFNTLDPIGVGASADSVVLGASIYDRLVRFDRLPSSRNKGSFVFDYSKVIGELAERFEVSDDGLTYTFHLRQDATFHDGRPVTAEDVKWSLDRAVLGKVTGKSQLQTGSLTDPEQFSVIDAHTFQIKLKQADRLVLPNLASMFAPIYNSKLVREKAGAAEPWGETWLKENTAGGGAYKVANYVQGQQLTLARNDAWKSGTLPKFQRVIIQTIPDASARANLISRGDADVTVNLLRENFTSLSANTSVNTIAEPMPGGFTLLNFNTQIAPFDNVKVRKALSLAIPYDDIFKIGANGLGEPLFGATWEKEPETYQYPQALPWKTDIAEAKRLLTEAGYPDGFTTKLHYATSKAAYLASPAVLIQEALAKIGVTIQVEPYTDAQWAESLNTKREPLSLDRTFAMFRVTDYFFRIFFLGGQRWNRSQWDNKEVAQILNAIRFEQDEKKYAAGARRVIALVYEEAPSILLWKPALEVVTSASVTGFTTWFHNQVDPRDLSRTA